MMTVVDVWTDKMMGGVRIKFDVEGQSYTVLTLPTEKGLVEAVKMARTRERAIKVVSFAQ